MAKRNKTTSGTNVSRVQQQNAASSSGQQFGTEFASETDVQSVREANARSQAKKGQNS